MADPCGDGEESFFITGNFRTGKGSPTVSGTISIGKLVLQFVEESSIENTLPQNSGIMQKNF
jgi:hypothetical protein